MFRTLTSNSPFSAPRDDTARASFGNGAKSNFLSSAAASVGRITSAKWSSMAVPASILEKIPVVESGWLECFTTGMSDSVSIMGDGSGARSEKVRPGGIRPLHITQLWKFTIPKSAPLSGNGGKGFRPTCCSTGMHGLLATNRPDLAISVNESAGRCYVLPAFPLVPRPAASKGSSRETS
jgi:hypothetical protein